MLITGKTGAGKTFLACALAHKACREGFTVACTTACRGCCRDLGIATVDGRYSTLLAGLSRIDLIVLDDWGLPPLGGSERRDLLEILEDRYGRRSTLVTSQLPVKMWHEAIGDATLADAILDRLLHGAYRVEMEGESMRGKRSKTADRDKDGA